MPRSTAKCAGAQRRDRWHAPQEVLPSLESGGLAFSEGSPGSTEFLFDLYGFVRDVVLSDPMMVLVRAVELAGAVGGIWGWFFPRDPLDAMSGREALAAIREYEKIRATPAGAQPIGAPISASDGGHTKVVISVANEDGSRTIVTVETD